MANGTGSALPSRTNSVLGDSVHGNGNGSEPSGMEEETGEEMTSLEETLPEAVEVIAPVSLDESAVFATTYSPPSQNFIEIHIEDDEKLLVNIHCRKSIFLDYVIKRLPLYSRNGNQLDLCDLTGNFVGLESLEGNDFISGVVRPGETYVPCELSETALGEMGIKPCIEHWEEKFPHIIDRILGSKLKKESIKRPAVEKSKRTPLKASHY